LTLHFSSAYIPSGWGIIAPTRSTWGEAKTEINIVAAMSSRKKVESTGGAVIINVDDAELGDVGFAMASSGLDGKPSWWGKVGGVHARAALSYSSARELATPEGPFFFFRVTNAVAPSGALHLGSYAFPLNGIRVTEFGVHDNVRQDLHFDAVAHTFGAEVHT